MKTTSSEHVMYMNCFECQNKKKQFMYTTCSELVVFMYWTGKSMNNLLSNCGLVDARIRASNRDLPVQRQLKGHFWSVAKVALRFGCAKQSKNLEWYLILKWTKLNGSEG